MKIAIAGFGQEGRASYEYWNKDGNELTIADERDAVDDLPTNTKTILGPDAFTKLGNFDLIIRSPSINPNKLPYGDKVWSATNEFFAKCPAEIIGVTGTKGKGTTSSLIASILKAAGKTVHLVGNIGVPALEELSKIQPDEIVVFELSSFQLWDLKKSPHVAVVLGIEADHLDVHADMDNYVEAKTNIVRFQTANDLTVYNLNDPVSTDIGLKSSGEKAGYPDQTIINTYAPSLRIPGAHNLENMAAAITATHHYISDQNQLHDGISAFTGLPHRIKFVREVNGIKYYDDSYSSAASATVAAIKSFSEPKIVIVGGYERSTDFGEVAQLIADTPTVKKVLLIGQTKQRIAETFVQAGILSELFEIMDTTDLGVIVEHAHGLAEPGDVVILSPGCPSYDMFKNFTERGEQFIELVNKL